MHPIKIVKVPTTTQNHPPKPALLVPVAGKESHARETAPMRQNYRHASDLLQGRRGFLTVVCIQNRRGADLYSLGRIAVFR